MTPHRGMRALFLATVAWAVAIVWLAPHPPMIDLPQHAGQVALLSQLLAGHSPWSHLVQPNLLTPYLGAFAPALPLSYVLPVATVLKILLSVAYLAFVWLGVALRRRFGADARLDWLCVPGFFGYAYEWGFLTFARRRGRHAWGCSPLVPRPYIPVRLWRRCGLAVGPGAGLAGAVDITLAVCRAWRSRHRNVYCSAQDCGEFSDPADRTRSQLAFRIAL